MRSNRTRRGFTTRRAAIAICCAVLLTPSVIGFSGAAQASATRHAGPAVAQDSSGLEYLPGTAPIDPDPSLPSVVDGVRPGPDVLYSAEPTSPQLENHDPRFKAQPLLVSGTEGYDKGEYLYQDYLYDDHGSEAMPVSATDQTVDATATVPLPNGDVDPNALNYNVGTITYPTDPVYAGNAADLVEFRVAVGATSDAYRFTLNTLQRADTTIIALAFDLDNNAATGTSTLPRDPGAPFPGTDAVLTTWGTGAEVSTFNAAGTLIATTPVTVTTDLSSAQITVTVPHAVLHPTTSVKATLAVGLYDAATGGWLKPGITATATTPGGAGPMDPDPSGIFNLGFRMDEHVQKLNTPPDEEQAGDLAAHDPTAEQHPINFAALYAGTVSDTVPATGLQIRIFVSRQHLGVGEDTENNPQYKGQLQPYAVYIPSSGALSHPHPLLLYGHSNGENYWQYDGSDIMSELGEAHDTVVLSPAGRARSGWYIGYSEYDVFEAWNDLAHHVLLDPTKRAIGGYSMGGYMTYRLGGLYPDLWGKAFSAMGPPGMEIWIPGTAPTDGYQTLTNMWLENNRNLPYLNYAEAADELVPQAGPLAQNVGTNVAGTDLTGTESFQALGYRYIYALFTGGEHYTLAILGYNFPMGAAFLADTSVDLNPAHVTYAEVPEAGDPALGLNHDHAYWVSGVTVADLSAGAQAKGVIDARSEGFGVGDPAPVALTPSEGVENIPYTEVGQTWSAAPKEAVKNRVDITLTNLSAAAIQLDRAKLAAKTGLTLAVTADRAATLTLADAGAITAATGTMDGKPMPSLTVAGGKILLPVSSGAHTYVLTSATESSAKTATTTSSAAGKTAAHRGARKVAKAKRATKQPAGTLAYTGAPADLPLVALALIIATAATTVGLRRATRRRRVTS